VLISTTVYFSYIRGKKPEEPLCTALPRAYNAVKIALIYLYATYLSPPKLSVLFLSHVMSDL
jgi:hypothetical protein